jgi:hypothetical protein
MDSLHKSALICSMNRSKVFNRMMELFGDPCSSDKFPFIVRFEGEMGVDTGGLAREAFSIFWEEACAKYFDGPCVVTPLIHAGQQSLPLEVLGRVLSYGYISSGFLPVKISFPTLAAILVSSFSEITAEMFLQSFKDYLTPVDLFTTKEAFCRTEYSRQLTTRLINIFSRLTA